MELALVPLALVAQAGICYLFIERMSAASRDARRLFAYRPVPVSLSASLRNADRIAAALPAEEDLPAAVVAFPARLQAGKHDDTGRAA